MKVWVVKTVSDGVEKPDRSGVFADEREASIKFWALTRDVLLSSLNPKEYQTTDTAKTIDGYEFVYTRGYYSIFPYEDVREVPRHRIEITLSGIYV